MSFAPWILAARPATLWAAVAPVAVGTACAFAVGGYRPLPALAALLVALLIQIGTNYANDLFDFLKGADTSERLGPTRAVQAGLLTPRQMAIGTVLVFALAVLVGSYLVFVAGKVFVVIGLASILAGVAYTGGPFPLAYHGLGDLFVLLFFGYVAVCGTAFVQAGSIPAVAWWGATAVGCSTVAILVVNNIRDVDSDGKAGKRTLAVRFGLAAARGELVFCFLVTYAVPMLLVMQRLSPRWVLLPWLAAPIPLAILQQVRGDGSRATGQHLNQTLALTARHLLVFSLLFAVGIAAGAEPPA